MIAAPFQAFDGGVLENSLLATTLSTGTTYSSVSIHYALFLYRREWY
jgi:hypothetical protein